MKNIKNFRKKHLKKDTLCEELQNEIKNEIDKISYKDFDNALFVENNIFWADLSISPRLQTLLNADIPAIGCEYEQDKKNHKYELYVLNKNGEVIGTKEPVIPLNCIHLDNLIKKKAEEICKKNQ